MLPLVALDIDRDGSRVGVELDSGGVLPVRAVLGIGRNYVAHAEEQGIRAPERPMVFTKNIGSCCLNDEAIVLPCACEDRAQVDYEGELAVVIARSCKDVEHGDVLSESGPLLGVCCANDVSARWWQKEGAGGQFWRGKSFDTFCPLGPGVMPIADVAEALSDAGAGLSLETRVNGEVMQLGSTSDMAFSVSTLVSELSRDTTLVAGTVLLTGTPSGVGMARDPQVWLEDGDVVEVEIEGVGLLQNSVRSSG